MTLRIAIAALLGAPIIATGADAANLAPGLQIPANAVVTVQNKQQQGGRDCTPYNGPFGFYGNVWCQPPSVQSYMRNLGSRWPQETPQALKYPKRSSGANGD